MEHIYGAALDPDMAAVAHVQLMQVSKCNHYASTLMQNLSDYTRHRSIVLTSNGTHISFLLTDNLGSMHRFRSLIPIPVVDAVS